ncbi:hypothetical protein OAV85_04070 [Candidatus Nanopelagicales bacterium]|nr:hypothetical protein [Candidatus Nanopelagicales bacterium]
MKMNTRRNALVVGGIAGALALTGGVAYSIGALDVQVPLFPVAGQASAEPCDGDGVSTSFAYGNSRNSGVKVDSVTVSGIDANCTTTLVEFLDSEGAIVATVSGPVASDASTISTNIWTNEFSTVRVTVAP